MKVLVTCTNGKIGHRVVRGLEEAGVNVVAGVRHPEKSKFHPKTKVCTFLA